MTQMSFDPSAAFDNLRNAWAPALRAQKEALQAIENFGRLQIALGNDYMDWTIAQAKAGFAAATPHDLAAAQSALATQFGQRFNARLQEFIKLATDAQAALNRSLAEATAQAGNYPKS